MLRCSDLVSMLGDLVSGELPQRERARVQEHLCCCPLCAAAVASYREVIDLAGQLPPLPVPPTLWDRLRRIARDMGVELSLDLEQDAHADSNPCPDATQTAPHPAEESLSARPSAAAAKPR